jgi:hypothetical protein
MLEGQHVLSAPNAPVTGLAVVMEDQLGALVQEWDCLPRQVSHEALDGAFWE